MKKAFKPQHYNSLSPYLILDDASRFVELMKKVFHAEEKRKYMHRNGSIMHAELLIDDTIIMLASSTKDYQANKCMLHLYVPDSTAIYQRAIEAGCRPVQEPVNKEGDPDKRGAFYDFAGNYWSVSTQVAEV